MIRPENLHVASFTRILACNCLKSVSFQADSLRSLCRICANVVKNMQINQTFGSDLWLSEAWECYSRQGQWSKEAQFKALGELFTARN
jgi:hypothetical protein